MEDVSVENLFARAWQLLNRNWSIVVPGLIVALVAGALTALLLPTVVYVDQTDTTVVRHVGGFRSFLVAVISLLGTIIATSYTTGMAHAAWQRGVTTFADGAAAFRSEGGHVFTALLALFITLVLAAILAPFTLGISLLAFFFLFIYAMPAAVIGERGGFGALGESYRIATHAFGTTAVVVLGLAIVFILAGLLAGVLGALPLLGPLVTEIIGQAALAYFTLVLVGKYLDARNRVAP